MSGCGSIETGSVAGGEYSKDSSILVDVSDDSELSPPGTCGTEKTLSKEISLLELVNGFGPSRGYKIKVQYCVRS